MALILTEKDADAFLTRPIASLTPEEKVIRRQAYSALDPAVTLEVFREAPALSERQQRIYQFEQRCQAAALAVSLRGVLIDQGRRNEAIRYHEQEAERAESEAGEAAGDYWNGQQLVVGRCGDHRNHLWPRGVAAADACCKRCGVARIERAPLNCSSSQHLRSVLYGNLGVKVRRDRKTGQPTTDHEALEAIKAEHERLADECKPGPTRDRHERIVTIADAAIRAKLATKQVGYARSRLGSLGRMRSAVNVGAAETGRYSMSKAPDGRGWNLQQISDRLRGLVIPDPGLLIGYADLRQAESNFVAYDSGDEAYLAAHCSGDVHTMVAKLVWPELPWVEPLVCANEDHYDRCCARAMAEEKTHFDPHHDYRDYGKRIQHGGNMGRTPQGVARQIRIPVIDAAEVYARMYGTQWIDARLRDQLKYQGPGAFPRIKQRHQEIWDEIKRSRRLINPFGRERIFLGPVWDSATLREALGELEQSPVADIISIAFCEIFDELDTYANVWDGPNPSQPNRIWLLGQVHDAILFEVRPGDDAALKRLWEIMHVPVMVNGRLLTLDVDIKLSEHSWAKKDLRTWHP